MFVQIMEGRVSNAEGLQAQLDRWRQELQPGAAGYLGATGGLTADGRFITAARFESADAAQANSERPEQGAWWNDLTANIDGEVTFTNCSDVDTFGAGGSDDAGFVQFIKGRADRTELQPVAAETDEILRRTRPDVLGGIVAWAGDNKFIQVVYFTSEDEARANEKAEPATDEDRAAWERMSTLMQMDEFIDISDPWLYSA